MSATPSHGERQPIVSTLNLTRMSDVDQREGWKRRTNTSMGPPPIATARWRTSPCLATTPPYGVHLGRAARPGAGAARRYLGAACVQPLRFADLRSAFMFYHPRRRRRARTRVPCGPPRRQHFVEQAGQATRMAPEFRRGGRPPVLIAARSGRGALLEGGRYLVERCARFFGAGGRRRDRLVGARGSPTRRRALAPKLGRRPHHWCHIDDR